jgi:hypothetical protein
MLSKIFVQRSRSVIALLGAVVAMVFIPVSASAATMSASITAVVPPNTTASVNPIMAIYSLGSFQVKMDPVGMTSCTYSRIDNTGTYAWKDQPLPASVPLNSYNSGTLSGWAGPNSYEWFFTCTDGVKNYTASARLMIVAQQTAGAGNAMSGSNHVAVGSNNIISGNNNIALGTGNGVSGSNAFAGGTGNTVSGSGTSGCGTDHVLSGTNNSIALGSTNSIAGMPGIAIGSNITVSGSSLAVGSNFTCTSGSPLSTAVGKICVPGGMGTLIMAPCFAGNSGTGISCGSGNIVTGGSIAIGSGNTVSGGSIVVGNNMTCTAASALSTAVGAICLPKGSVNSAGAVGATVSCSAAAITPAPIPDIKANGLNGPITIPSGSSATLTWVAPNALSCTLNGQPVATSSTGQVVTPLVTTTFTLTCTGLGGTVSDSVTVNVTPNSPPLPPTICCATTGFVGISYPFAFTAIDPDFDTIHYEIDWDNNGTVDQTLPAGFVPSGTTQTQPNNWAGIGVKNFKARTVDSRGGVSAWTPWTITITTPPILSVSPLSVDFGTVAVNEIKNSVTMNASWITIINAGGGLLDVTGITSSAHFACISGCTGALAAGLSQVANIRLTAPATPGALIPETITVNSSNAGSQDVSVYATIVPVISINPGLLDFGDVILKKCSADKTLTINNNSSTVTVPAGTLAVAPPFSCATTCDYPEIPPGGSATIMMRYCPTALGVQNGVGTLSTGIQDNTGDLRGKGLPLTFNVREK